MTPLGLQFRLDDLSEDPREVCGEIAASSLDEQLAGMVGELGYRAVGPAVVRATAYRSRRDVFVDAEIAVKVGFGCVRCLDPLELALSWRVRHLLVPGKREAVPDGEVSLSDEDAAEPDAEADADADLEVYEGDIIDLVPLLREDIVLEMPMNPTCVEARGGPCARYEEVLSSARRGQDPEAEIDPRWAPLAELKKKLT